MSSTTKQLEDRVDSIEERLDRLEAQDEVFASEIRQFVRERADNPQPVRRKATPAQRAARRKNVAKARAAKPVGKGRGAVATSATKRKLKEQR